MRARTPARWMSSKSSTVHVLRTPNTEEVSAMRWREMAALGHAGDRRLVAPGTAAHHSRLTGRGAAGIRGRRRAEGVFGKPIGRPLPHIPRHVGQPEPVRHERPDRRRPDKPIVVAGEDRSSAETVVSPVHRRRSPLWPSPARDPRFPRHTADRCAPRAPRAPTPPRSAIARRPTCSTPPHRPTSRAQPDGGHPESRRA